MTILQNYVFREWAWTMAAVSVVLLIVLMGTFVGELLNDMADGRIPPGLLGTQLVLHIPEALGNILPMSAFIAVMWGLGRLYRDQEMVVMRSSGFSWHRLVRPLLMIALPVSVLLLAIMFWVSPRATQLSEETFDKAYRSAALWGLQAGRFHVLQDGTLVVYVESLGEEGDSLENVFIQQVDEEGRESVWSAARGEYWMDQESGVRYLTLYDGQVTESGPGMLDVRVLTFGRNDFRVPEQERRGRSSGPRVESLFLADLLARDDLESIAEFQWRIAPPLAVLVLGLLAIPLSHSNPREGRNARVMLGMLSYALYANTLHLSKNWIEEGVLPPAIGLWWVHALVFVSALILLQRQGRIVGGA